MPDEEKKASAFLSRPKIRFEPKSPERLAADEKQATRAMEIVTLNHALNRRAR